MKRKTVCYLLSLLVICGLAMQFVGCKRQNLKKVVAELNDKCPMSLGLLGEVDRVWLEGNTVFYEAKVNNALFKVSKLKTFPEEVKEAGLLGLVDGGSADALLKENVNLKYVYIDPDTKDSFGVLITHDDLSNTIAEKKKKEDLFTQRRVDNMFAVTKLQLPMRVDEATLLVDFCKEGDNAVYIYEIDGDDVTPESFKEVIPYIRQNVISIAQSGDPSVASLFNLLTKANMGLVYRYHLSGTDEVEEFSFTSNDVAELANKLKLLP